MRACARCGHENPDPLVYCFQCGGRLPGGAGGTAAPAGRTGGAVQGPSGSGRAGETIGPTAGFAATVALPSASHAASAPASTLRPPGPGPLRGALHAVAHLWGYIRGRIRAEDRKRVLAEERRGAERMIEAALADLGAAAIAGPSPPRELAEMAAQVEAARQRRHTATADLANAEKLQAVEDLRLGRDQAAAESEWKACTRGAEEMDRMLRELGQELEGVRRDLEAGAPRPTAAGSDAPVAAGDMRAAEQKQARLTDEFNSLRERAAALRASTTAARSKLDQATAARRTAATAMAAGFAAQTRARADADRAVSELIAKIGGRVLQQRLPLPELLPRYARIDRMRQTIDDSDRAIVHLDQHLGGYDNRKLAIGAVVTAGLLAALATAVWALVR